jgi:glycosyltransferase involved in cell wall biosynthesis
MTPRSDRRLTGTPPDDLAADHAASRPTLRVCRAIFTYPTSAFPGAGLPAYYLSEHMDAQTLLLTRRLPGNRRPAGPNITVRFIRCPNPVLSGVRGRLTRLSRALLKTLGMALFAAQAAPLMVRFRPDVVHIHTPLPLLLAVVAKALRKRVLMTVHGTDLLALQRGRWLRALVRLTCDEVCYVSAAMDEPLRAMFPRLWLLHTPSGVDLDIFQDTDAVRRRQIITVGSLRWQKGYPTLLKAFQIVRARLPDYTLVMVGDGVDRDALMGQARDLGLEDSVTFKLQQPQERIAEMMNESALFVLSSVSEGFPKVLLEALACGLPLAVTDVGHCGELVRGHGVGTVAPPDDPERLAGAILDMLTDQAYYDGCAAKCVATAQGFAWGGVADIVHREYRRLLAES